MRDPGKGLVEPARLAGALNDFQKARARASMEQIVSRLTGKSTDLLSFEEVSNRLHVTGKASSGRATIPLDAIVGSVGRYADFSRTFLPRRNWDAQRWAHVKAANDITILPPIDVYQIGDAYFVLDGNHRVSIARQQGATHIDAIITTIQTRVPLSPDDDPDTLIVKSEYASFLADTRLHQLRPGADVRVSAAGQYAHLENLIEAHRYLLEVREERVVDNAEAVARWYDDAYLPVVETIRDRGILRYFPGRTETDLYVFIATHQAHLRRDMGWTVAPEVAAVNLLQTDVVPRQGWVARGVAWLRERLVRRQPSMAPRGSWSRDHVAARYSGQLFADLLVPFQAGHTDREALAQALHIAQCEGSRIFGLHIAADSPAHDDEHAFFYEQCQAAGVEPQVARASGPWAPVVCDRAALVDLVITACGPVLHNGMLETLLQESPRPMMLVPGAARPIRRLLLYYDGGDKAREALFAATYMAEQWGVPLHVLISAAQDEKRAQVEAYLELHELTPSITMVDHGWQALAAYAGQYEHDLLVLGYPGQDTREQPEMTAFRTLLRQCDRPLLVCT